MKQKTLNLIVGIIAFVLINAIVVGMGSSWFTNKNFSTWFNSWGKGKQQLQQADNEYDSGLDFVVTDDDVENPIKLMVAPIATATAEEHKSYQITAKLTPSYTTDVVDMSIAWQGSGIGNIGEYVKFEHAEGALTAKATVLQPYTTTILLTATVRDRGITKTIKLDYLKHIDECYFLRNTVQTIHDEYVVDCTLLEGSIYPSKIEVSVSIDFHSKIKSAISGKGFNVDTYKATTKLYNFVDEYLEGKYQYPFTTESWIQAEPQYLFTKNQNNYQAFHASIYNAAKNADTTKLYEYHIDVTYYVLSGGKEVVAGTYDYDDFLAVQDLSGLAIPATGMEVGDDVVFW